MNGGFYSTWPWQLETGMWMAWLRPCHCRFSGNGMPTGDYHHSRANGVIGERGWWRQQWRTFGEKGARTASGREILCHNGIAMREETHLKRYSKKSGPAWDFTD